MLSSLPVGIFRAKGFVHLAEAPDDRVVAHVVGRRVDLRPLGDWGSAPPRTELVFISLDGAIDTTALRSRLAATARERTSMRRAAHHGRAVSRLSTVGIGLGAVGAGMIGLRAQGEA